MYKMLFVFFMIIFFINFLNTQNLPSWVIDPPKNENEIYAIGISSSKSKQLGIERASNLARAEISRIISVRVMSVVSTYMEEIKKSSSNEYASSLNVSISEAVMKGAKISNIYEDRSTKVPTYYVLISISKNDLKESFSTLTDEKVKKIINEGLFSDTIASLSNIKPVKDNSVENTKIQNTKTVLSEPEPKTGRVPNWVISFPKSDKHYVGVGEGGSIQAARDSAIAMIVSQIRSKISGELKTEIREINGRNEEALNQIIKNTIFADIEDIEYVDSYLSNEKKYYAYYRLDIEKYRKRQEEKQRIATERALDFLKKSDTEVDISLSLKNLLIGYVNLAPFIMKDIKVNYNGKEVILINELLNRIQQILSNMTFNSSVDNLKIDLLNFEPKEVIISVLNQNRPFKYFPFVVINREGDLNITKNCITDDNGVVRILINGPGSSSGNKSFVILPDILTFIKDNVDEDTAFLYLNTVSNLGMPTKTITVNVSGVSFSYVVKSSGSITKYNDRLESLSNEIKNGFQKKMNVKFEDNARFVISVNVSTNTTLSESSGMYFTRLIVDFSVFDKAKNQEIFNKSLPEIKGGSNTEVKSIQKAIETFNKNNIDILLDEVTNFLNKK